MIVIQQGVFFSPGTVGTRMQELFFRKAWKPKHCALRNLMEILSYSKLRGLSLRFSPAQVWMTRNFPWQGWGVKAVIHAHVTLISSVSCTLKFSLWLQTTVFSLRFIYFLPGHWLVSFFIFTLVQFPFFVQHFQTYNHNPSGYFFH